MLQSNRAEGRHNEEREQQGPGECGDDGDSHGTEHASFQALQCQDGEIDRDDDEDAEDDGTRDLVGGLADGVYQGSARVAVLQPVHAVFDHHDGAVDDGAEVNRPETHEVDRDSKQVHSDEAEEKRERDRQRYDNGGAPIAQEDQQYYKDEHGRFDEIALYGCGGGVDDVGLVVEGHDLCAARELQIGYLVFDLLDDLLPVLSAQDDYHAGDGLSVTILHDCAVTRKRLGAILASCFNSTGIPPVVETTMLPRSSTPSARPMPRTVYCCSACSM